MLRYYTSTEHWYWQKYTLLAAICSINNPPKNPTIIVIVNIGVCSEFHNFCSSSAHYLLVVNYSYMYWGVQQCMEL